MKKYWSVFSPMIPSATYNHESSSEFGSILSPDRQNSSGPIQMSADPVGSKAFSSMS